MKDTNDRSKPGGGVMTVNRFVIPAAAALALTLTGCDNSSTATAPNEKFRPTAPISSQVAPSSEDLFLTVVRQEIPDAGDGAVRLGKTICDGLDDGLTPRQVVTAMIDAGGPLTASQKGTVIGAAIPALCPQHEGAMDAFFEAVAS